MRLYLAMALCGVGLAAQGEKPATPDEMTFRALCGTCHSTTLVEGLRTEDEWREEIDHMIKIGARGTEAQFQSVMRVLARTLTKVNVNAAEAKQIAPVLDISAATAAEVVKRRAAGKFKTLAELKAIPGMDPEKLEARKDRILF